MARLGAAFMLGGLATTTTLLLVRSRITQELGLEAAGQFAAAWGITMTYVGFLLGAMAADYYPRLTEVINDRPTATRLMNDQAQLGLAIGGPVLLLLIGLAPWAVTLLYSNEFAPAAGMLQWQTVGNVFKLASWPLSFAIVASARAKTYFLMELSFNLVFLALLWILLPVFGLEIAALAFLAGYVVYFITVNVLAHILHGFRWQSLSLKLIALHVTLSLGILALAETVPKVAAVASICLALGTGIFGLRVVLIKVGPEGRIAAKFAHIYASIGWPIRSMP
ncbi:PST family polysaccharide transporter [Cereibacter changlensis]|nr:PST family polysaccharide transporter [Cereibacter changlensis]